MRLLMRVPSLAADTIRSEAREWGLSPAVALALSWVPIVGGVAIVAVRLHKPAFEFLTAEDSVLEWLQVAGYSTAAVFAALIASMLWRSGRRQAGATYALLALGCFFITGEELAWGQRILGLETPEALAEVNKQNEVTLHNIEFIQQVFNLSLLFVGFLGSIGVWLIRSASLQLRPGAKLFLPPVFLTPFFLVLFLYRFIRFSALPDSSYTITRISEWTELCLAAALACFAVLVWRRLRAPSSLAHALSPHPVISEPSGSDLALADADPTPGRA